MPNRKSMILIVAAAIAPALCAISASASEPAKKCGLKQYASLPITYSSKGWAEIPLLIDNHPVRMIFDTGSAESVIGSSAVQQLGLKVEHLQLVGITAGKEHLESVAFVHALMLGNALVKNTTILIMPTHPSEDQSVERFPVGRLGMDLLSGVDVELDLGHDKVNLFSAEHCPGVVVYWADQAAVIPMRRGDLKDLYFVMELDGKKLQTKVSTAGPLSALSTRVTRSLYGWDEDSPGVQALTEDGTTRHYRNMTLTAGGLQVLNTQVMLVKDTSACMKQAHLRNDADGATGFEGCGNVYPLHLGLNVLKKLRLYLATKEQKLYITPADAHK